MLVKYRRKKKSIYSDINVTQTSIIHSPHASFLHFTHWGGVWCGCVGVDAHIQIVFPC